MKKVTAFIGSAQKKGTYQAIQEFEKCLKGYEEIEFEYVFLSDYHLEFCRGCKLCFDKGEGSCPLKDDRDLLIQKMEDSDGVIFATPSYAFQVSARMKNFLDRTAFIFHRPRFFGKVFTGVVSQGIPAGGKVRKYIESSGGNLGFDAVKGTCVITLEPMTENRREKLRNEIKKCAERFYKALVRSKLRSPSLFRLMLFRFTRTGLKNADVRYFDYYHYMDKGWFQSDYYYETRLGPMKKLAGHMFDSLGKLLFKSV